METHRMTEGFEQPGGSSERQLQQGTILVNRYSIQDVVGIGGMGNVYRARDLHFSNVQKWVAVKEMINQARDPLVRQTIVQNFEREANILATLNHPAIPKIYDYFTYEERSYLVLEYIQGKDLEALMNETTTYFAEEQVVAWAIELCDVLNYLHRHTPEPIIFRDMKPSNVMVRPDNHIVLVDFGIAKAFKTGQKGTMIGTEGYSPPEQYRGEASHLADIYSLGATLHHLLTRRDPRLEPPFTFNERPVRLSNPSVSIELEAVIRTALQYNAQDRFQTAEAMKDALLVAARKTGMLGALANNGPSTRPMDNEVKPAWVFRCEDEVRGSPMVDSGILYVGAYDNNLYALNAADGRFLWKYPTEGGVVSRPVVDEGLVIFGSEDSRVYALVARSGKISWTYLTEGPIRSSPRTAEGQVFIGSDDNRMYAIHAYSGRQLWMLDVGAPVRSMPVVQNELLYFGSDSGEVICADFKGQNKWRFRSKRPVMCNPHYDKGMVFITSLDGNLYALDARSGWVVWRFRMSKGSISSVCQAENLLFFGSADNNLYAVDVSNGREAWRFETKHQVSGSPVVHKDSVYCGSADGNLYCLEYRTGRLRWKFSTGGPITGTPIVYNDILYFGSTDHQIFAINV